MDWILKLNDRKVPARAWIIRLLHWTVMALCLTYAFWGVDVDKFLSVISSYNLLAVFTAVILLFSGFVALARRLNALSKNKIGNTHSLIGTIIGQGANNVLPAKLGEAVKTFYISRESSRTMAWVFGCVFWERFFDLNALLLFGIVIVFTVNSAFSIGSFFVFVIVIWLALFVVRLWPNFVHTFIQRIPFKKLRDFSIELLEHLTSGLDLSVIFKASIWTIIIWLQYVAQVAVILLWAAQIDLSITAILVIFVVSGIGLNLAASPGGIGVYEAAIIVSASWYGVGKEEALASAIVLHVIQYVPTTLLGIYLMFRADITFKQIQNQPSS